MGWILELDCSFPFLNKSGEHFGYVILDLYWCVCVCVCVCARVVALSFKIILDYFLISLTLYLFPATFLAVETMRNSSSFLAVPSELV